MADLVPRANDDDPRGDYLDLASLYASTRCTALFESAMGLRQRLPGVAPLSSPTRGQRALADTRTEEQSSSPFSRAASSRALRTVRGLAKAL